MLQQGPIALCADLPDAFPGQDGASRAERAGFWPPSLTGCGQDWLFLPSRKLKILPKPSPGLASRAILLMEQLGVSASA